MRLTRRGERVLVVLAILVLLGAMWMASALGFWITGVEG